MKNTIVLVVLFTTLLANANASLNTLNDARKTTLTIKDVKAGDELLIKNVNGIILYKELIQSSGEYIKGFDLTELPKGDYFFELNKFSKIEIIPFIVSNNTVVFKKDNEVTIFKPRVTNKLNKVYISKLSLKSQPFEIKVYYEAVKDNTFSLIYKEEITDVIKIGRILSLDIDKKGKYKIITKSEGRTFVDYIQI